MFFTPFITGLLPILATSTQIETPKPQQPSIFILGDHKASLSALGSALQILGYTRVILNTTVPSLNTHTYAEFSSDILPNDLTIQYPNSKFILPTSSISNARKLGIDRRPCANSWLGLLAAWRPTFEDDKAHHEQTSSTQSALEGARSQGRLLEVVLDERESHRGDKWLRLCNFLDLGYSIMERLKLKEFPSARMQQGSSWGERIGMWGIMVQKSG